jgi:hypothetical protein
LKKNVLVLLVQSALKSLFQKKITHLTVTIDTQGFRSLTTLYVGEILLSHVFKTFTNLLELDLNGSDIEHRPLISLHGLSPTMCHSTTLVCLRLSVPNFDDCLTALDGRFLPLRQLSVIISKISSPSLSIPKWVRIDLF